MNSDFYVYVLKYPDGTPFYVGKGRGGRWLAHETEAKTRQPAKSFDNPQKVDVIRRIWRSHGQVITEKVTENVTEDEAFKVEIRLIKKYGLRSLGGLLTNQTYGGKGTAGHKDVRQQKAAEAYVNAYAKIKGRFQVGGASLTHIQKRIVSQGYSEVMAYLAGGKYKRGSHTHEYEKNTASQIFDDLDVRIGYEYVISVARGTSKAEAQFQAERIKEFALVSGLFTAEEASTLAREKAGVYLDWEKHLPYFKEKRDKIMLNFYGSGGHTEASQRKLELLCEEEEELMLKEILKNLSWE